MPAIDAIVRINGLNFSWASCLWKINGLEIEGITAVDYEQKRERPPVYGARKNGTPLGKPAGKYSAGPISVTMLRDTWAFVRQTVLTPLGLGSYGDANFIFMGQYGEPGAPPTNIIFTGCTIDGAKDSHQEGTDALTTDLTIGALGARENGQQLWSLIRSVV